MAEPTDTRAAEAAAALASSLAATLWQGPLPGRDVVSDARAQHMLKTQHARLPDDNGGLLVAVPSPWHVHKTRPDGSVAAIRDDRTGRVVRVLPDAPTPWG